MQLKHNSSSHRIQHQNTEIDSFRTIDQEAHAELKVSASRFLGFIKPLSSIEEFTVWITDVRKRYYNATHHCFAYRIGIDENVFRCSDDGEPGGTAGKRILAALESAGITQVGMIVVRYFGGTKLGTGGLARAYGDAANKVISQTTIIEKYITERIDLIFTQHYIRDIYHIIEKQHAAVLDQSYVDQYRLRIEIRKSKLHSFIEQLQDATNGGIRIEPLSPQ